MSAPFAAVFKGTEKGSKTEVMGDRVMDQVFDNEARLIGVIDARGDNFRFRVAQELEKVIFKRFNKLSQAGDIHPAEALRNALSTADKMLRGHVETKHPNKTRAAGVSMAVGLLVRDDDAGSLHLYTAHFGDCRIYHFRNGQIISRTEDQTEGTEKVKAHQLSEDDLEKNPGQYRPVNLLGGPIAVAIDVGEPVVLAVDDRVLFCTDGVHDAVDEEQLRDLALGSDMENIPDHIIQYAEINGNDDKSVLLMGVRDQPARIAGPGGPEDADPAVRMPDEINIPASALDQLDSVIDLSPIDRGERDDRGAAIKTKAKGETAPLPTEGGSSRPSGKPGIAERFGRKELFVLIAILLLGTTALALFLDETPERGGYTGPVRDPSSEPDPPDVGPTEPTSDDVTNPPIDTDGRQPQVEDSGEVEPVDVGTGAKDTRTRDTVIPGCKLTDMTPRCLCPLMGATANQCAEFVSCKKAHMRLEKVLARLDHWSDGCMLPISDIEKSCVLAMDLRGFGPAINLYNDLRGKYETKCAKLEKEHRARVKKRNMEECKNKLAASTLSNLTSETNCKQARLVLGDTKSHCQKGGIIGLWDSKNNHVNAQCTQVEEEVACDKAIRSAETAAAALTNMANGRSTEDKAALVGDCKSGSSYNKAVLKAVSKCQGQAQAHRAAAAETSLSSTCRAIVNADIKWQRQEEDRKERAAELAKKKKKCNNMMSSALTAKGKNNCKDAKAKIEDAKTTCIDAGMQKKWGENSGVIKSGCKKEKKKPTFTP